MFNFLLFITLRSVLGTARQTSFEIFILSLIGQIVGFVVTYLT